MFYISNFGGNINRREFLKNSLYSTLGLGISSNFILNGCAKKEISKKPNIIFIVIDTLRADHLGCSGYNRDITPNIDSLANDGYRFDNAISSAPWTIPAVGTILTGQYPCILGIKGGHDTSIREEFSLISEVLKKNNYQTKGIMSHIYVGSPLGFGREYDHYDEDNMLAGGKISSPSVSDKAIKFFK